MDGVETLQQEALGAVSAAFTTAELRELELKYLGKSGLISGLMREIGKLSAEERPAFGQKVNAARATVQAALDERVEALKGGELDARFGAERIDITLPSRPWRSGLQHILDQTTDRVKACLCGLGFEFVEGPELEQFAYNFDALNYPPDHPAMDEQDTFYVDAPGLSDKSDTSDLSDKGPPDRLVLRTQCTAIQGRTFEKRQPPLRIFTVGRTFRNEAVDRTHGHTFHQVDAFMVDEGVSMAHLKGTLGAFVRAMFGDEVKVRFRPDFFPFVEPGVDYAISSPKLFGGRWVELGGAGLVHPKILQNYGIDSEKYTGFAFGLGLERIPMMATGVDDLRHFLENDLRFLEQFR
ncbi:MAG: phenylalanine--tRNA ligase subunit alpha [Armatimonadetes bacterium]|nr:phenylalanine--tRNA ligase subunit alpha [Armatimonadota bacterium]